MKSDLLAYLMTFENKYIALTAPFIISGNNVSSSKNIAHHFLNLSIADGEVFAIIMFFSSIVLFAASILILKKAKSKTKGELWNVQRNSTESKNIKELLNEKDAEAIKIREYYENITEMLAHDLKNPLNIILHQTDHLHNNGAKQAIENAGNLMMNMLQNVLDVQKYNGSKIPLNKEKTNLAHLISNILEGMDLLTKKKNVKIRYHSEYTCWVLCDADIVSRVLTNLLINFIKYAKNNETINIQSVVQKKSVRISVFSKIDSETIKSIQTYLTKQVFEITESKSSSFLRILFFKLAIESHSENLGIENNPSNGAELWFTLPLVKKENEPVKNQIQNGFIAIKFRPEHIVILDGFIARIRQYSIYELSKIKAVINEIPDLEDNIVDWKNELFQSLTSMNEQRFIHLLDSVTKSIEQHEK